MTIGNYFGDDCVHIQNEFSIKDYHFHNFVFVHLRNKLNPMNKFPTKYLPIKRNYQKENRQIGECRCTYLGIHYSPTTQPSVGIILQRNLVSRQYKSIKPPRQQGAKLAHYRTYNGEEQKTTEMFCSKIQSSAMKLPRDRL